MSMGAFACIQPDQRGQVRVAPDAIGHDEWANGSSIAAVTIVVVITVDGGSSDGDAGRGRDGRRERRR